MPIRPYLTFAGTARQAFSRYHQILGGELVLLAASAMPGDAGPPPAGMPGDAVMHAALMAPSGLLMGADDTGGRYEGAVDGMCVNIALDDVAEANRVFDALADGGVIQQPVTETFFSPAFGLCTDRFGTPWMVMVDAPIDG